MPVLEAALPGESLPWSFALFVGTLGIAPAKILYQPENAFSFGFAKVVHSATLEDGETEMFVVRVADAPAAKALARAFTDGFLQYGEKVEGPPGLAYVEDQYIARVAAASAAGRFVVGVRGAEDAKAASSVHARLAEAVAGLPDTLDDAVQKQAGEY